jgi:hypothetical protein
MSLLVRDEVVAEVARSLGEQRQQGNDVESLASAYRVISGVVPRALTASEVEAIRNALSLRITDIESHLPETPRFVVEAVVQGKVELLRAALREATARQSLPDLSTDTNAPSLQAIEDDLRGIDLTGSSKATPEPGFGHNY